MNHKYASFIILIFTLLLSSIVSLSKISISGTKFITDNKAIFMNGANTPWDKWNDFGGAFDENFWNSHFATLKSSGINSSRIWISCNGLYLVVNDNGAVKGATDKFWQDVDKLFQLAENNGIYIMATLMSFDFFKDEGQDYLNWRKIFDSESNMDSMVDNYIVPFVKKYKKYNSLWSIDLCNEPDWINENSECGQIGWDKLNKLFTKEVNAIHQNSNIPVTIGFGMIKYNSKNYNGDYGSECGIDFDSTHFYEWEAEWFGFPFDTSPKNFGLTGTRPAVIGEFPAYGFTGSVKNSKEMSGSECYINCYNNGWNGIMAWTSNGVDSNGNLDKFVDGARTVSGYMS